MRRYRITYYTLDGGIYTKTLRAPDPAAALGILLDEQEDLDVRGTFTVQTTGRRLASRPTPRVARQGEQHGT